MDVGPETFLTDLSPFKVNCFRTIGINKRFYRYCNGQAFNNINFRVNIMLKQVKKTTVFYLKQMFTFGSSLMLDIICYSIIKCI